MRITKFGHACVRVEYAGVAVVVDPGMWTDPDAVAGAAALLITHEHPDHYDPTRLRASDAPIFTVQAVATKLRAEAPDIAERVTVVGPGDAFQAGLPVRAVGELHAVIHPEFPRVHNCGYLISAGDQTVFHPGDALTPPGEPVDLLCVVVSAPWMRAAEAVDFARLVGAPRNLAIHDRVYSESGLGIVDGHLRALLPGHQRYDRIPDGAELN